MKIQKVTIDSLSGPQQWSAPAGWKFDKTQALIWVRMVNLCRSSDKLAATHKVTKRELAVIEGKLDALANILACTLGMAGHYWVNAAKEFAKSDQ